MPISPIGRKPCTSRSSGEPIFHHKGTKDTKPWLFESLSLCSLCLCGELYRKLPAKAFHFFPKAVNSCAFSWCSCTANA